MHPWPPNERGSAFASLGDRAMNRDPCQLSNWSMLPPPAVRVCIPEIFARHLEHVWCDSLPTVVGVCFSSLVFAVASTLRSFLVAIKAHGSAIESLAIIHVNEIIDELTGQETNHSRTRNFRLWIALLFKSSGISNSFYRFDIPRVISGISLDVFRMISGKLMDI